MILNVIRKHVVFLFAIAAIAMFAPSNSQAQSVMTHHTREAVQTGSARLVGRMPATTTMSLDLVLPLRDPAGLKSFLSDIEDPKSPNYRHFVTPAQFTAKFGPTQQQYDAVLSFARNNGLTVTGGSRDGMEVQVKGTVAAIESAFHIAMHTYTHPTEGRTFYAPDREPTVNLPFNLWHVSGLDNYSIPHPLYEKKSDYAQAHGISPEAVSSHATTGSGPSASFLGSDMRAAYYGTGSLTGAGQNLGLWEFYGTDLADLTTYFKNVGQTNNVPITLLSTDGTSTSCVYTRAGGDCDDGEQNLDMTQAIGMAPGLASLTMYIGSTDTAIISSMTTHSPLPTTIGCSWGYTPADASTLNPYLQKMAAQGQNFFAASGDSSTWSSSNEAWPADAAYLVSVGGTDLTTASAGGAWKSETAWVDSGGGITPDSIAIPSWQQLSGVINSSNKGSTTLRNGPDVSANANFSFYTCADQQACQANNYGGTSFAAPMWAAYIALVNQQLVANGQSTLGFLDPIIYPQNVTSAYTTNFHDITSGTSGSYSATTGYDLVTGWGSPNAGLLAALTGSTTTPPANDFSIAATSPTIAAGASGSSSITTAVTNGSAETISLTASAPTGITVALSPTSVSSGAGSTATITVASTVAAGTYSVIVTGTAASGSHTATITVTVTSTTGSGSFTVAVSPTSGSLPHGSSGTATVTTTVTGGFSAPLTLTATGMESGVTVSFSPNPIAAPGSGTSTMTVTATRSAARKTFPITITATGGGKTATATLTLTISR